MKFQLPIYTHFGCRAFQSFKRPRILHLHPLPLDVFGFFLLFQCFLAFFIFPFFGPLQTRLLGTMGELAGGGSVAVAVGVWEAIKKNMRLSFVHYLKVALTPPSFWTAVK